MSVKIPTNYPLEPGTDIKVLRSRKYQPWTVADLLESLADFPADAPVWITRYDETVDDIFIHPLQIMGGCVSEKRGESFVTL